MQSRFNKYIDFQNNIRENMNNNIELTSHKIPDKAVNFT